MVENNLPPGSETTESSNGNLSSVQQPNSNPFGCLTSAVKIFCFFFFIVIPVYEIVTGNFSGFYDFSRHALFFLVKKGALSILLLLLSAAILFVLSQTEEFLKKKRGFLYSLFSIIEEIPVLNNVLKVAPLLVEPQKLYKKALRKNNLFIGPLLFALIAINAETPILSFFKLPPAKNTAAYIIYKITIDETLKAEKGIERKQNETTILDFILTKYDIHSDPLFGYLNHKSGMLTPIIDAYESRMQEKPQFEYYSEFGCDGISLLELILEAKLNVRTADQVHALITDAPKEIKQDFDKEVEGDKEKTEFEIFKENIIYIPYIFVNALFFFLITPRNKRSFGKALAVSSYLIAALELMSALGFVVLSLTNYLFITFVFLIIIYILFLQVWLAIIVPALLKISGIKTWFLGNLTAIIAQITGLIWINYYFHIGFF